MSEGEAWLQIDCLSIACFSCLKGFVSSVKDSEVVVGFSNNLVLLQHTVKERSGFVVLFEIPADHAKIKECGSEVSLDQNGFLKIFSRGKEITLLILQRTGVKERLRGSRRIKHVGSLFCRRIVATVGSESRNRARRVFWASRPLATVPMSGRTRSCLQSCNRGNSWIHYRHIGCVEWVLRKQYEAP